MQETVYSPREDSFLLIECVEVKPKQLVLDIGTGSGIQAIKAASMGAKVIAVDISSKALEKAAENAARAGVLEKIEFRESDLFKKVKEKFDAIIFNPPYVPSEGIKLTDIDGGKNGREVLDRFLAEFKKHLQGKGKCFFLQSSLNGVTETEAKLEKQKMRFRIVGRKRLFFEELLVFKAWRE